MLQHHDLTALGIVTRIAQKITIAVNPVTNREIQRALPVGPYGRDALFGPVMTMKMDGDSAIFREIYYNFELYFNNDKNF